MREGKYIIKHMCAANSHNTTFNSLSTTRKNMPMRCPAESVTVSYNRHLKTASYCCLQLSWQLTAAESLLKFHRRWQKTLVIFPWIFPARQHWFMVKTWHVKMTKVKTATNPPIMTVSVSVCTSMLLALTFGPLTFDLAFHWAKVRSKYRLKSKSKVISLSKSLRLKFRSKYILRPKLSRANWLSRSNLHGRDSLSHFTFWVQS